LEELDKDKTYFVYCLAGGRSAQACGIMKQLGFEKVYNLVGGISQWEGPVEN
jgi:rhodanese-related sulfurtransferase